MKICLIKLDTLVAIADVNKMIQKLTRLRYGRNIRAIPFNLDFIFIDHLIIFFKYLIYPFEYLKESLYTFSKT